MKYRLIPRLLLVLTVVSFACNAPFWPPGQGGGAGGRLVTVAAPQALLSPEAYAQAAQSLAQAIAELNRVQEQTLANLRTSPTPEVVEADLVATGAAAMTVAQLAEQLAASTASQSGGSDQATAAALPYVAAAQMGYLMVIQAQNLRDDYKAGRASSDQVTDAIGQMGGRLWSADQYNTEVTPAPFADARANPSSVPSPVSLASGSAESVRQQVDSGSGKATELAAWNASAPSTETIRITVPMPRSIGASNGLDPAQLDQMRTPEGQDDSDVVRLAAAAKLVSLGGTRASPSAPGLASLTVVAIQDGYFVLEVTFPAALVFQSDLNNPLPYFPDGQAGATSTPDAGNPLVSPVTVADGQPQVSSSLEVATDQSVVTLEILDAVPTGTTDVTTRDITLTVQWTSSQASPSFTLACFSGSGDSASNQVTTATGQMDLTLSFNLLRDTAVCHAKTGDLATTLGESQIIALEPESAGNSVTYLGTFNLIQNDDGCNFSAAPYTAGTFQIVADFTAGTASGSFSGSGQGVRAGLECTGNFADLTWSQSYTGTFSGTVDPSTGAVNLTGTLSGTGDSEWTNCHDAADQPTECPAGETGPYSYPITVAGTLNQAAGSGNGTISVTGINLATAGEWAVGSSALPTQPPTATLPASATPDLTETLEPTATRVTELGTGDVQITLIWNSTNDLDLYVTDPNGETINFDTPTSSSGGLLDVDANLGCFENITPSPVENIFWPEGGAPTGTYQIMVNYYQNCEGAPASESFTVRVLVDGETQEFTGTVSTEGELIEVHEFTR